MNWRKLITCKTCGCESSEMKIHYQCDGRDEDCTCHAMIGFKKEEKQRLIAAVH